MERFKSIEAAWLEVVLNTVRAFTKTHPDERFYAGAFWLCYVDYTMFGVPCFALNTEAHLQAEGVEGDDGSRWSPPNWAYDLIDNAIEPMRPHYEALTRDLEGQSDEVWDAACEAHFQLLARVCREATTAIHQSPSPGITEDFVIGIFEEREGEPLFSQLVRASIDPDRLARLPSPIWE